MQCERDTKRTPSQSLAAEDGVREERSKLARSYRLYQNGVSLSSDFAKNVVLNVQKRLKTSVEPVSGSLTASKRAVVTAHTRGTGGY